MCSSLTARSKTGICGRPILFWIVFLYPSRRNLENGFTLIKGQLSIPIDVARSGIRYKYIVYKKEKGKCRCLWEYLEDGSFVNRHIKIPHNRIRVGGKLS